VTGGNVASAKMVGKKIAELAKQKGFTKWYSIVAATSIMAGSRPWPMRRAKRDCSFRFS
jgi:ribosomal protein L18